MRRLLPGALITTTVVGVALLSVPAGAAPVPGPTIHSEPVVVATGLNNPRQLSVSGADLYVAEAGRGGTDGECGCAGATGSVARVTRAYFARSATPVRTVTGLLSEAAPDGSFAVGSDGVSVADLGRTFVAMTYEEPDLLPAPLADQSGKLLVNRLGRTTVAADISGLELVTDPDGEGADSNPYAVLALPGRQLVADAAGNTVIEVRPGQAPRVFAVLPEHDGEEAVPTSLAVGPKGVIYVGEFGGGAPGTSRVDMFSPTGQPLGFVDGFTTVAGVAVGKDGTLYVSELFAGDEDLTSLRAARTAALFGRPAARIRSARAVGPTARGAGVSAQAFGVPGQVTTVRPNGTRSSQAVPLPAGVAVDGGGHVYVSAWSILDGDPIQDGPEGQIPGGQVWRLS